MIHIEGLNKRYGERILPRLDVERVAAGAEGRP